MSLLGDEIETKQHGQRRVCVGGGQKMEERRSWLRLFPSEFCHNKWIRESSDWFYVNQIPYLKISRVR